MDKSGALNLIRGTDTPKDGTYGGIRPEIKDKNNKPREMYSEDREKTGDDFVIHTHPTIPGQRANDKVQFNADIEYKKKKGQKHQELVLHWVFDTERAKEGLDKEREAKSQADWQEVHNSQAGLWLLWIDEANDGYREPITSRESMRVLKGDRKSMVPPFYLNWGKELKSNHNERAPFINNNYILLTER